MGVGGDMGGAMTLGSDSIRAGISVYSLHAHTHTHTHAHTHTRTHTHTHTTHIAFCSWHAVLYMLGAIKLYA